jgi:2EXR family
MGSSENWEKITPLIFPLFSHLPVEIRNQIWKTSLTPRIVKWMRMDDENIFEVPSKTLPLFSVNRESREAAFFYGEYQKVSTEPRTMYFSPVIDYLLFDPGWVDLVGHAKVSRPDPIGTLLPELSNIRNIMVHPNYTEERKTPTSLFENLRSLQCVLVAADEKMIGAQRKHMVATVYDIDKYFMFTAKQRVSDIKRPYIAVGCVGWVGAERHRWHHPSEDHRQLVAVFDNEDQMAEHAVSLRDEEWKYVQERFKQGRPKSILKFRQATNASECQSSSSHCGSMDTQPPSYSEPPSVQIAEEVEAGSLAQEESSNARNKRQRVDGDFQGLQAANTERDEELPGYDQIG